MNIEHEKIIAMAVAAICEETGEDASDIRVVSFREVPKSPLEQYIAERGISYHKYQLGE